MRFSIIVLACLATLTQAPARPEIIVHHAKIFTSRMTLEAGRDRAYFARHRAEFRMRIMPMIRDWSEAGAAPVEPHDPVKIIVDETPIERSRRCGSHTQTTRALRDD